MFKRPVVTPVFFRQMVDWFSFDIEILLIAQGLGFKIRSLPIQWENHSESKVRLVSDGIRMLLDLISIKKRVRFTLDISSNEANLSHRKL